MSLSFPLKFKLHFKVNSIWKNAKKLLIGADSVICYQIFAIKVMDDLKFNFVNTYENNEEVLKYVIGEITKKVCSVYITDMKTERNRQVLIGLFNIMAENEINDKGLSRQIINTLFNYSDFIDRELYLFEYARFPQNIRVNNTALKIRARQQYFLEQVSSWMPENVKEIPEDAISFLDFPLRKFQANVNTSFMAEALIRLRNPEMVLDLLRYGYQPSCIYLWPLCLTLHIQRLLYSDQFDDPKDRLEELRIIRYYCRARHYIYVQEVDVTNRDIAINNIPAGLTLDDVLLLSPGEAVYIPEDRRCHPSTLEHQCRLRIRKAIRDSGDITIPRGIEQLPVTKRVKQYLDLMTDRI